MNPPSEVLSEMIDGEAFDQTAARRALESSDGRDWLVDALALRRQVRDVPAADSAQVPRSRPRRRRLGAAAAIAAVLLTGAVWSMNRVFEREPLPPPAPSRPPQADLTVELIPVEVAPDAN